MYFTIERIKSLPGCNHRQVKLLPEIIAIYFIVSRDDEVLYIGATTRLRGRLSSGHVRLKQILGVRQYHPITIYYFESTDRFKAHIIESALIRLYRPIGNVQCARRDSSPLGSAEYIAKNPAPKKVWHNGEWVLPGTFYKPLDSKACTREQKAARQLIGENSWGLLKEMS